MTSKFNRVMGRAAATAVICGGVAGLGALSAQAAEPIKIGFVTEMTGPWAFFGTSCVNGLKMGEKEVNDAGGALGRPLDFVVADDQTNPQQAVAASRSLDTQDQVVALSGPTSSDNALAMYGYAEQNHLPFLVPVAAYPQLTKPGTRYTFRIEPDAAGWGYAIAKYIEARKPGAKIALMYSDFALMRAIFAGLKYQAERSKLAIVSEVVFPQGSTDATVQAAQVRAAGPDFVISVGGGGFDNTITNQLLDLGIKPAQIIHPYGITTQILGWGKRDVGSLYGSFFDQGLESLTPAGRAFIKNYKDKYGRPASYIENYCYVTPFIFKAALEAAGSADREKLRNAISALKMKEPTSDIPIAFDENGARAEYIYYMEITGVTDNDYTSKQVYHTEWQPTVIPVNDLVK